MNHDDDDHGHSIAAWTAVSVVIVASAVMSAAVLWPNVWLFAGGAALAALGAAAGKVLSLAGYGAAERDRDETPSIR
ncbi:MAG: HGxxPAAW family protein [Dermatophilaceae bacterium]